MTAINPATGSLTINHQEIEGLMPAMEMLFHVDPRTLSDHVKPGDKVEFQVEGKTYTIRDIKVIEPSQMSSLNRRGRPAAALPSRSPRTQPRFCRRAQTARRLEPSLPQPADATSPQT